MNIMWKYLGINALIYFATFTAIAQDCGCACNLDSLRSSVEKNYVGFQYKIDNLGLDSYQHFTDSLYSVATTAKGFACYEILKKYVSYFHDPHLGLGVASTNKSYAKQIAETFSVLPSTVINLDSLHRYYERGNLDGIEGIWENEDNRFKVAVFRDKLNKNKFIGLAVDPDSITWFIGQKKMEIEKVAGIYNVTFYKNDHFPVYPECTLLNGYLSLVGNGVWTRIFPLGNSVNPFNTAILDFKVLSPRTCILKIGSFWISYKKELDSLVGYHLKEINKAPNLIIDLRDNGGGHSMTFDTLLPLIYSDTMYRDGFVIKSSPENIEIYKEGLSDPDMPSSTIEAFNRIIEMMEKNPNKLVKLSNGDTTTFDHILSHPKKVLILVNKATGSASESFLRLAKQNKKVISAGTNTKGALDFTEIGRPRTLPWKFLVFSCPMGMTEHRLFPYIDNIGMKPDIVVPPGENDWIQYAVKYLEQ